MGRTKQIGFRSTHMQFHSFVCQNSIWNPSKSLYMRPLVLKIKACTEKNLVLQMDQTKEPLLKENPPCLHFLKRLKKPKLKHPLLFQAYRRLIKTILTIKITKSEFISTLTAAAAHPNSRLDHQLWSLLHGHHLLSHVGGLAFQS